MVYPASARIRLLLLLGLVGLWGPSRAAAATDEELARDHTKRGMAAYNLGHYAEAASEFEAAYRLFLDPALLFNIAQAYRLNGEIEKALNGYRSYLRTVPPGTQNRAQAERWRQELERTAARARAKPGAGTAESAPSPSPSPSPPPSPPSSAAVSTPPPAAPPVPTAAAPTATPSMALAAPDPGAPEPATTLSMMPAGATQPAEGKQSSSSHWWIWTIAAAVAVGAGVTTALLLSKDHANVDCLGISPCGSLH